MPNMKNPATLVAGVVTKMGMQTIVKGEDDQVPDHQSDQTRESERE